MPERLVLCGGARQADRDSTLSLALHGPLQNITLKLEDIAKKLVTNIPDRLIDLVEIATYVFCADQERVEAERSRLAWARTGAAIFDLSFH